MAEMSVSLEMDKKERVGQQTFPAAQLDTSAGRELVTMRHHGSPRSVGEPETKCAMFATIAATHSLGSRGNMTDVYFSGDEIDTSPLQFDSQFTINTPEMSKTT